MEVRVFDKGKYEGNPTDRIREVLEKIAPLGYAVIAVRGPGFSANLTGLVYIGRDGDDPVLKVKGCKCADGCNCHIHLMWDKVLDYTLALEDVGHGEPEPVIYLTGEDGEPIVNLFYPGRTYAEIEALLI